MKINFSQMYEGWKNKLIPPSDIRDVINQTAEERTAICRGCEWHSKNKKDYKSMRPDDHCTKCGCTISAKVRCLSCKCPLESPLWNSVATDVEEHRISKILKKDGQQ